MALRTLFGVPRGVPQIGSARGTPRVGYPARTRGVRSARGTPHLGYPAGYPPYEPRVRAGYVAGYPTALGYPAGYPATYLGYVTGYPATYPRVRSGVPRHTRWLLPPRERDSRIFFFALYRANFDDLRPLKAKFGTFEHLWGSKNAILRPPHFS